MTPRMQFRISDFGFRIISEHPFSVSPVAESRSLLWRRAIALTWLLVCVVVVSDHPALAQQKKSPSDNPAPTQIVVSKRRNLGDSVNSQWNEIIPVISADGKTLYFDRKLYPRNVGGEADHDDIWYSEQKTDGTWSIARNLAALNTRNPNAIFSVLPDNNTALYWGAMDSTGHIAFALVQRTLTGWTQPKVMRIKNFYNRATGITASLGADGRSILMAVRRDDSPGTLNIYVSFLLDEQSNSWSEPTGLGPQINTAYGESSPLLGADGTTLYFSSARPGGAGEINIFTAKRLDSTWKHWSNPVPMGDDFNFPGENYLNSITASGEYAYLGGSVENPGKNMDLFRIQVPEALRVRPVVLLKGLVFRAGPKGLKDAAHPLAAKIIYERLSDGTQLGIANTNPATGAFQIALPGGEEYGVRIESENSLPLSDHLDYRKLNVYTELNREFLLPQIAVGSNINLNNIFFDVGKAVLHPASFAELNRLAGVLNKNTSVNIVIEGHTDDAGTDEINDALSVHRAEAVKNYFTAKGVAGKRIAVKGFGKRMPVAANNTDEGRGKNRRVVVRVVAK